MESILTSIKKMLGIEEEYTHLLGYKKEYGYFLRELTPPGDPEFLFDFTSIKRMLGIEEEYTHLLGYKKEYGYFLKQASPAFIPEISVVPEITVGMIPLAQEVPVVDRDSVTVAPGTISAGMVSLAQEVPSVDTESIKVAPGAIVVDLFVPET